MKSKSLIIRRMDGPETVRLHLHEGRQILCLISVVSVFRIIHSKNYGNGIDLFCNSVSPSSKERLVGKIKSDLVIMAGGTHSIAANHSGGRHTFSLFLLNRGDLSEDRANGT